MDCNRIFKDGTNVKSTRRSILFHDFHVGWMRGTLVSGDSHSLPPSLRRTTQVENFGTREPKMEERKAVAFFHQMFATYLLRSPIGYSLSSTPLPLSPLL